MAEAQSTVGWRLRLYVAGSTARSSRAIRKVTRICAVCRPGCELEIVDVYQRPDLAAHDGVIAVPTLVRHSPLPVRRLIGDLSDRARLQRLFGLATEAL